MGWRDARTPSGNERYLQRRASKSPPVRMPRGVCGGVAKTRSDGMRSKGLVSRGQEGRVARTELVSQLTISAGRPQNHDRDASS